MRFVVVCCTAALIVSPSAARATTTTTAVLSVSGPGNAAVSWHVSRPVTLSVDTVDGGMNVQGGRAYVGVAVHDARGALVAAAVNPKAFKLGSRPVLVWLGAAHRSLRLERGTYTMTLLGDATARVTIRVAGLSRDVSLRASRPSGGISAASFGLDGIVPVAKSGGATLRVAAGATYGVFAYRRASTPSHDEGWLCLRPSPGGCSSLDNDFTVGTDEVSLGGESVQTTAMWITRARPGRYDAAAGFTTVAASSSEAGFAMSIRSR